MFGDEAVVVATDRLVTVDLGTGEITGRREIDPLRGTPQHPVIGVPGGGYLVFTDREVRRLDEDGATPPVFDVDTSIDIWRPT